MKRLLFFALFLVQTLLDANEYAIISNRDIDEMSVGQIKALYLKKTSYIGNKKIIPINLSSRNSIRMSFEKSVLHMSFTRLKTYWTKQHYLGHRPPITMKSQKSVQAFIKKVDGAIGYIELKNLDDSMKIIYRWSD